MRGQIDGERVQGPRSAFFDTLDLDFGVLGSIEMVIIVVTSLPDGCDVLDDIYSTFEPSCEDLCDEYIDIAEDYSLNADEYYMLWMTANTEDGDEGEFDFDNDLGDEEFSADYFSFDARPLHDTDDCEDACKDGDLLDAEIEQGKDGTLVINRADSDVVTGRFNIEFGGNDELTGSFKATECDMSQWIWYL
jgi:hypothetical protein